MTSKMTLLEAAQAFANALSHADVGIDLNSVEVTLPPREWTKLADAVRRERGEANIEVVGKRSDLDLAGIRYLVRFD